jgi:hypothetical protein
VYYNERHDFWALSRFNDANSAHRDPKTFSSAHGTVLELMSEAHIGEGRFEQSPITYLTNLAASLGRPDLALAHEFRPHNPRSTSRRGSNIVPSPSRVLMGKP